MSVPSASATQVCRVDSTLCVLFRIDVPNVPVLNLVYTSELERFRFRFETQSVDDVRLFLLVDTRFL